MPWRHWTDDPCDEALHATTCLLHQCSPSKVMDVGQKTSKSAARCVGKSQTSESASKQPAWNYNNSNSNSNSNNNSTMDMMVRRCKGDFVHVMAGKGRVDDLEKTHRTSPEKLTTRDSKGRTALHYAALNGQVSAIEFLLTTGMEIGVTDSAGNTPLHLAVENDHKDAAGYLVKRGAPTDVLNALKRAPIHVAVELNRVDILRVLINSDAFDVNLGDGEGATGLHYSAWKDHPECARVLLEAGAAMCKASRIGLFPLHVAAQSASSKTLQAMLDHAEKAGYKRENILKFLSQEKLTPLHAAISSGEAMGVQICIDAGAQIDVPQEDGCNAIHLAAAQGATNLIRVMFEMQPDKKAACIMATDKQNMTPLHKAALFDRDDTVLYLLEQNADIDSLCDGGFTPMLLAASKSSWRSLAVLMTSGADCTVRDDSDQNILHMIIKHGGKMSQFNLCLCSEKFRLLLDERDKTGCTPLHFASREGNLDTIESLLKLGAVLNAKNNCRQSPLHFAARYGRYNTCKRLLDDASGHMTVNETDETGKTPIHVAALNGHVRVVRLLLQNGAGLLKDVDGNTPLHLAAKNGYTHTMTTMYNVHPQLIDSENKDQDTPLHLAAKEGQASAVNLLLTLGAEIKRNFDGTHFLEEAIVQRHSEVCMVAVAHDRWREILHMCSTIFGCSVLGFIKYMPDVCQMVLDRCKEASPGDPKARDFYYTYDFTFLQLPVEKVRQLKAKGEDYTPMMALNTMVKFNRENCLSHPLCLQYLKTKWSSYGLWFHLVNLLIYVAFLTSLTVFVAKYKGPMQQSDFAAPSGSLGGGVNDSNGTDGTPDNKVDLDRGQYFLVFFILCFCILNAIKEVAQMVQQKWKYLLDYNNALEWILYITSGIFIGPFIFWTSSYLQWECGAICVFLAWFNLLLFLQRFDFFGIYVVMFLEILKTLVQVIIVFSVLIIAFGLSFYILLKDGTDTNVYNNPAISLLTTIVMMLGNIEYTDNWVLPIYSGGSHHNALRCIMLILFVLLMPILLINLLIGLAVGDIESVQRNARLKRLAMQVELHTDIEKKLPQKILEKVDKPVLKVYPNKCFSTLERLGLFMMTTDKSLDDTTLGEASYHDDLYQELEKQKVRLKSISKDLCKQHDLLKLIVQKMEIQTEADVMDEGESASKQEKTSHREARRKSLVPGGWSSPTLRSNVLKQAAVINKWKNIGNSKE